MAMEDTGIFQTLNVNPKGKTSVNFYFFLVELLEGSTITFSKGTYQPAENNNSATISYTADYGNNPPVDNAPMVAYMLPFIQQYEDPSVQDNAINLNDATLYVYEKGKDNPKVKGTVQGIKTTQRPTIGNETPTDFVNTVPKVNEIRYCIAEYHVSTTNKKQYFVIAMSKTDKSTYNNLLKIQEKENKPGILVGEYQAQTNSINNSGNVCAIGCISSSKKDEFTNIELKDIQNTSIKIKYDSAHIVNCDAADPELSK